MNHTPWVITISVMSFTATFLAVYYGTTLLARLLRRQEQWYEKVLVRQLLMDISPRMAVLLSILAILIMATAFFLVTGDWVGILLGAGLGALLPNLVVRHLEQKRRARLDQQLVDGITTLSSGVRAGLNIVQSFEMLVQNSAPPMQEEFAQLLREYRMGLDLNQVMRNAANRIGSRDYRLLFSALEMHRQRGGDAAESLDRLADSVREIQRLEGKLDALTAQGRYQAWIMACTPPVLLGMFYVMVDPDIVMILFTDMTGRVLLASAMALTLGAFVWIRRIMAIDI